MVVAFRRTSVVGRSVFYTSSSARKYVVLEGAYSRFVKVVVGHPWERRVQGIDKNALIVIRILTFADMRLAGWLRLVTLQPYLSRGCTKWCFRGCSRKVAMVAALPAVYIMTPAVAYTDVVIVRAMYITAYIFNVPESIQSVKTCVESRIISAGRGVTM